MDSFKTFYNEKNGKYILFFGFYLIFFIFLGVYLRQVERNRPEEVPKEESVKEITTYDISNLINNEYDYTVEIINDNETIDFKGSKSNIDYANYENKYFLDIYNINQLLKKSKLVSSENYILTYELQNKEINELLLTEIPEGINKIAVHVNDKGEINTIVFDLTSYFAKEKYEITINYMIGENNENSSS